MRDTVVKNIRQRFRSYSLLFEQIAEDSLTLQLPVAMSKSVGEHMWCIVGARESYTRALLNGKWDGFACSLKSDSNYSEIKKALDDSSRSFDDALAAVKVWTEERDDLLVHLLEHETMHEGQLIRHLYALGETVPSSIKWA
ncbi:hypothetical protein CS022_03935 [Veronia nyctiphanis]|uniref:DinB family protein n=1 Tax=Veronia nyctiphanis TaxID=1278244 RepID=A0A4Q0YSS7_9GAMM|nr:DinB family protein [Veronia nyctiphanis]RXJ74226.1 hypothetical protein CS022_03935 [Veronia nyctiphanis]